MQLKHMPLTVLLTCITPVAFAYQVNTDFMITNNTNTAMMLEMVQPNGQPATSTTLPAHKQTIIELTNGDNSGKLYQKSSAPFKIKTSNANPVTLVNGRIVYYVGTGADDNHSFLNAVTYSPGLTVDIAYTCRNGEMNKIFKNIMIIDGSTEKPLTIKKFPSDLSCQGLKSSEYNAAAHQYTPTCFDGKTSLFYKADTHAMGVKYTNGDLNLLVHHGETKGRLDYQIGYIFCETWL